MEIEAKLSVDSLAPVRTRLTELGAQHLADQEQEDTYFDDAKESLVHEDRALRLRIQISDSERQFYLTYKGPKQANDLKTRQEIEFQVGDAQAARAFIEALAFQARLTVKKTRQAWRYKACQVGLDHVPQLGYYVEIEGPDNRHILQVQKDLGLADLKHIQRSYASLIADMDRENRHIPDK